MRWLWPAAWATALFWMFTVPVFTAPEGTGIGFVLAAAAAAGLALRKRSVETFDARWLVLLVPAGLAVWTLPYPFRIAPALLGLAVVLLSTARISRSLAWVGLPVGWTGLVLSIQAAAFPILYIFASRVHELPRLTPLLYALSRPFAEWAALSEGEVVLPHVYDVFAFPARLEALGFLPLALFALAAFAALVFHRRSVRTWLGFLGITAVYALFRCVFLMFLTVKIKSQAVFWEPVALAASVAPLVLLLMATRGLTGQARSGALRLAWPGGRRALGLMGLVAAGTIGIIGLFAYHDPGVRKPGRLLIEEIHSDWEWTLKEYDTRWYGRKSGYNYYCLAQYLDHFYHVDSRADSLLPDVLSEYDIVLLKTPTEPYSREEMDALVDFVRDGGGLWVHGDHTNVFGISTYLNPLMERFGMRFRYDSTYQLETMALSLYERPPVFAHPVVHYMPPYLFATSCTLEAPFLSENQLLGYALKAGGLDYSQTSFFPKKDNRNYAYGVFVQQGGAKVGKGRVAGYTDSTCFSNFFMFLAGKPELALATVEWLNRTNRFARLNALLFWVGLGLLVAAGAALRRAPRASISAVFTGGGFLGVALAVLLYDGLVRHDYAPPTPHTDYTHVAFEMEHSRFTLPIRGLTRDPEMSLHTFFVWTQRLGFFPSHETTLEKALAKGDLVVIADPWRPFELEEIDEIVRFVSRGGRLLVLLDERNPTEAPRQLVGSLGIRFAAPPAEDSAPDTLRIQSLEGHAIVAAQRPVGLAGASPRLLLSDGRPVLMETRIGRGRVFLFGDIRLFTDHSMGHTGEWLDTRKRTISELEYWMIRDLMDVPQDEPFWTKEENVP